MQAQKSFKTFVLVLSVSLILFSGAYYFVDQRATHEGGVHEQRGVVKQEPATLDSQDENDAPLEQEPQVKPDVSMRFKPSQESSTPDDPPGGSAFGALSEQELVVPGSTLQNEGSTPSTAIGGTEQSPLEDGLVSNIPGTTLVTESVLGSSTSADPDITVVSESVPVGSEIPSVPTASVTTQISGEEEVVARLDGEVMEVEETNLTAVNETAPVGGPETNMEPVRTVEDTEIAEESNTGMQNITPPADEGVSGGTVVMTAEREKGNDGEVLSGTGRRSDDIAATENLGLKAGLGISVVILVIAVVFIIFRSRRNKVSSPGQQEVSPPKESLTANNVTKVSIQKETVPEEEQITSIL